MATEQWKSEDVLLGWLKNRSHPEAPEARAGSAASSESKPRATGKFGLEALEPRVLLSGDTPFAEVYQSLLSDEKDGQSADRDVYSQQLDNDTSAEIAAANGSDSGGSQTQTSINVAWPESWQAGDIADSAATTDASGTDESDAAVPFPATENGVEASLLEQAATSQVTLETSQAEGETLPADASDQDVLSDIPSSELPRGPPVDEQPSAVVIAAESIQISELGLSESSETDEGEAFGVQFLEIAEVTEDGLPRAPPVALSNEALAPVLEEAKRLWTAAGVSLELAGRLAGIQVQITDLSGGELGQADQAGITLDTTAAGRGWFVDQTPGDNVEFSLALSDIQLAAVTGSPAHGRIDLLTVLVHEIGHVLGFDHHAGLAVMGENLNTSQRVLLNGNAGALPAGWNESASGAQQTLNLVVGDQVDLAIQAFADAQGLLATIQAAAAQELSLIGMSLNQLLLDTGFDLFGEFEDAVAPMAGAVAAGTLTERFAELEELLEDAFSLADVGGAAAYDNAEIELAYDAIDDSLDIVFAFELADTDQFVLDEVDLTWDLGLAFTLGIDFAELVADPDTGLELTLDLTGALTGAVTVDTSEFDASGVGSVELDLLEMLDGSVPSVSLEVTGNLNLGDAVYLEGTFGFERRTGESLVLADGATATALSNVDYTLVSGEGVAGFFGVNGPFESQAATPDALGLSIRGIDFSLLLLTNGGFDYTALTTSGGAASFVGIPDLVIGASAISVALNSTSDTVNPNRVLDFNDGASDSVAGVAVVPVVGPALELEGEDGAILDVSGDFALDAFGFVVLAGTFNLVKQTDVEIDDGVGAVATFHADVLSLSLTASGFVGSGASLSQDPLTDASTVTVVTTGAIGFNVPTATLDLVILQDTATPANKYTGLQVGLTNAGLVGIDELGLTVSGTVQVNKGPAAGRLNWSEVTGIGVTFAMDETVELAVRDGSLALDAFGFVVLAGTFNMVKQTNVAIDDGNLAAFNADVLSLSMTASGFAGVGGSLSAANDSLATVTVGAGAIGFSVPSGSLDLVLVKDRTTATNKYTGLQVTLANAGLVGIDELGLTVSGTVQVNKGPAGGRLDWTAVTGTGNELPGVTLAMDQTVELAIRDGSVALDAFGFVVLAGSFTLVKQTNVAIDDDNLDPFQADVLSLTITASGFAGVGGSLSAANNSLASVVVDPDAIGFNVPSGSLNLVLVKDRATPANKYTGLQVGLTNAGLVGMTADFGLTVSGEVQVNKGPAGRRLDWTAVTGTGNELPGVTLAMDETVELAIRNGSIALDAFGFVQIAGTFHLVKQTNIAIDDDNLDPFQADVLSLTITASGFAGVGGALSTANDSLATVTMGVNAMGFSLPSGSFDLVLVKDRAVATNKYTGLQIGVTNAGLVGIDQLGLTVSGQVQVNKGPAAGRLDWTQVTGTGRELPTVTLAMDQTIDLAIRNGSIALDAFGFVVLAGTFNMVKQTDVAIDDGNLPAFQADVLSLTITASGFAGVGGALSAPNNSLAAVTVGGDAIGFSVPSGSLELLLVKDRATPANKFTGLQVGLTNAALVGMPAGFGLTVSGTVQVNKGPAAGRLDWSAVTGTGNELAAVTLTMDETMELAASGTVGLDVFGFVQVFGNFALAKYSTTVTLAGQSAATSVDVLAFGMDGVDVFVGAGPYFNTDGTLHANSGDAVGLLLEDTSLALALFTRTAGPGSGTFYAVRAFAGDIDPLGLELGSSDTFVLDASGYRIEINGGSTGAINFAAGVGAAHEDFEVQTGPATSEIFRYSSALQRVAVENGTLIIGDYVYVSGGFSFTRQTAMDVELSGVGTDRVDVLAFGAGNVDIFVGSGPYFIEGSDDRDPGAVGLALENVNFGLLLMKSTNTPANKYTSLMATADRVGLVGLDSLKLSVAGVTVEYNSSNRGDNKVIDFSGDGDAYLLDTGNGELEIDYSSKVLRASVEEAELQIESYVFISGGLAFERGPSRQVNLTTGTATVSAIDIGAQDLTMFFGVDGPYWDDLNGDHVIDTGETNPDAVGFAITNANLAMTLLKPSTGTIKYLALHATADQLGFVGIEGFQLEAATVAVDLNLALGTGVTNITPVVKFSSTYDDDERQALFDVFDTDDDDEISADELTAAIGAGHGVTEPLTAAQELVDLLNTGGAPPDAVLFVDEVVGQLAAAFSTAHLAEILAIDADGDDDGKFDPIGYEIKTGSGYLYLAADSRQIHASADNVVLNVAEFLNVKGSVALDIGSRETVSIRTGIPASIGSQATAVVEMVNTAIDGLEDALADLKSAIQDAIDAAIESVRAEIDGLLDEVIDSVVDYLKNTFASYVGSLSDLSQAQLDGAIAAVTELVTTSLNDLADTLTVDSLIDQLIDPIVTPIIAALPDPLKGPVGDLLDTLLNPIREKVSSEFGGTLEEALSGSVSRIAGSVSVAIEAALQAAAATATATFDAAVDQARASIEAAISTALDPQFDRVSLELDKVLARATARLDPLFVRLHALTEIEIGDDFTTMEGVEVEVTALGISNASAFVGLPPSGGFDFDQPFADQIDDAVGLYIDGLNLALGIFKPVLGKQLPTFTALKLHADDAGFSDGGNEIITLIAEGIDVELNLGGPIIQAAGGLFGNATIDFAASFPALGVEPVGYAIQTSTSGDPIYIDFADGEVIRASIEHADLQISEFVHITGSIAFEKGTIETVDVTGGLTGPAVDAVLDELGLDSTDPLMGALPWAGGDTAELSFMTIGASNVHAFVGIGGPYWTDTNGDDIADTDELSDVAKGLWIEDFDFGMAIMRPTNVLDFAKYFALKATANEISVVGIEGVEVTADDLLVEVNQSTPSVYGLPLFPVVDFASTYESERQALFDLLAGNDSSISVAELTAALGSGHGVTTALTTVDQLMTLLDIGGAPPDGVGPDGILTVAEVTDRLTSTFRNASSGSPSQTNLQRIQALDADGDGKFDPAGYEVNTGGTPVYLAMDSSLIRAQGFLELNLFGTVFLTGSVAFELGPTQEVTLTDGITVKTVTTMTIGAANVTAFIGADGPYWTDVNGDHTVDTSELDGDAIGFHITDLDMGIMVMASTDPLDLGVYLAAKASVHSFGLVGIDVLTATGQFDIALNVGIGASGLDFNADVVDFVASFPVDSTIIGDQLGFEVNTGDPSSPVVLDFDALLVSIQLGGSVTIYSDQAHANPVVKLNGLLLFEVDDSGLKAFVAAGLEFGPDIGRAGNNKFFDMNALGALVINADGIAADIDVSVEIGGALDSDLSLDAGAHARLVLNTTGNTQSITIPARYVGFLDGTVDLSSSALGATLTAQGGADVSALESIAAGGTLDNRFTAGSNGDLIFSISATAPTMASLFPGTASGVASDALPGAGAYFAVAISAHLGIGGFTLEGRFGLIVDADALQLLVEAKIDFFSVELRVKGEANIVTLSGSEGLVLKIQATLSGNFGISGLFDFDADLELQLNTRAGNSSDAYDLGIARDSFRIDVKNAELTFLSVITLSGSGYIEVNQGVFRIQVTLHGNFLNVATITASAFFSSEGEFEVILDGGIQLGPDGFNISGTAHLEVSYLDSNGKSPFGTAPKILNIAGSLTVSGEIFYISLGSFTIGVSYNSGTGDITVRTGPVPVPGIASKEVDFGLFTATVYYPTITMKYLTFTVGTLKIVMPPPPQLGQVDSNGVLTLNVGSQANRTARNLAAGAIDEEVMLEDGGAGSSTGRKIEVTMFGVTQTFDNVLAVQIADMADGTDYLSVADGVTTPVTVHFGSGADTLEARGSGVVIAYGDAGNDNLTGGTGNDQLEGGANDDIIQGGRGLDITRGGDGNDLFTWSVGDGNDTVIDGQGGTRDAINIIGTAAAQQVTVSASGSGFAAVVGAETLNGTAVETADIEGRGGSDTFVVNDLTPSTLRRVDVQFGADNVQDSLVINGSGNGETFTVSVQAVTPVDVSVDILQISRTDGVTVNVLNAGTTSGADTVTLNALGGADTVNVRSTLAGLATTITGGEDSDTFNIGVMSGTTGDLNSIAAPLTISGNAPFSGSDVLNVYDTADTAGNSVGNLTSTAITGLGNAGSIAYDTIEHLNIFLGSGGDTFTVQSTHAGATVLNTNGGVDRVNVRAISGSTTVNGGDDSDIFSVGSLASASNGVVDNIAALLTINGNAGGADALSVDETGEASVSSGTLTGTTISGLDMAGSIAYGTIETLTLGLGSNVDTLTVESTHSGVTTINGNDGADIFNVRTISGITTVNGNNDADTFNVGSLASASNGVVDNIGALLTVNGNAGADALNVDDSGETSANTGTLTGTTISGLDMAGSIAYDTIETLTIGLGSNVDTLTVDSTHSGVTTINGNDGADIVNVRTISGITTVNGNNDSDTFNVGSLASASNGVVDNIAALLTVNGNAGADALNVDDSGETSANTGTLTGTTISGLDMAGSIAYGTVETLTIGLGSNIDTFNVDSTHVGDTVLNTNAGADVVNIRAISGATTVNGGVGSDNFNVGSNALGSTGTPGNNSGGTVDNIAALLTVNGNDSAAGSDVLIVDDTGDGNANTGTLTATAITGLDMGGSITYGTIEHLTISLGSGGNTFTIGGTHGSATGSSQEDTVVNMGSGADTVHVNDVADLLYVNGQGSGDTVNVNGTGAGSVSTLSGDGGSDVFNVRGMNGTVDVNGGDDDDGINAGSDSPLLPASPTGRVGTIDAINGLLTVNGGNGTDVLNVDDSAPAVSNKSGMLTASTLRGLGLEQGIDYGQMETLSIWLATGDNTFTITSTHAGSTTVSTALGNDTVNVDGASGVLTINAEAGNDTVNVRATGLNSQTRIYGQEGNDIFNLSDHSSALPDAYPTVQTPPAADTEGNIDAINGLIVIDGGDDMDRINVDDSRNAANKAGTLTSGTLRGLGLEAGVDYGNSEDFNLWLGTGTDGLLIDSTHAGTTQVYAGDGNATVNQRDDTIAIRSISGVTTVHGQGGNDFFYVNVTASAANDPGFFTQFKTAAAAAANESLFNALFTRTHANALGAVLNLHGEGSSDQYTLNFAGQGQALVNVFDNGAPANGVDTLIVNGAATSDDTFLLRRTFVALLNDSDGVGGFDQVERVNYDENINARLIVNGLDGNDTFVADDNSSITTLDGGDGDDIFQIGQVFGTLRDAAANVAASDAFDTTPVIIGVITDPVTGAVIFNPTSFDPVTDMLSQSTIDAINAAILYQRNLGLALDGVAYVSKGVSHATTIFGGSGQDAFNVYHNKGTLRLEGEADNDTFVVRAFVTIDLSVQGETEVNGGAGTDTINYAINAPVSIDGGTGFDKVVVLGTPFNDSFVVTSEGIFGAGLNVKFVNIESAELDTLEGNDTIYILGTSEDIVTTIIGGLGDDTINVMGDVVKPIVSDDLLGRSGVITQGLTSGDAGYNLVGVNGVAVNVISAAGASLVNIAPTGEPLRVTEDGSLSRYFVSLVAPNASALGGNPVYLTVSAGVASGTDRNAGGAGVLVRVNGGAFTNAVVLTFDATTATSVFEIEVMAVDDGAAEGPRMALISHSINSADSAYDDLPLIDIFVDVVDNDQPGLDIRHLSLEGGIYGNNSTQVLENGFSDIYSVALTAAPAVGETVTVTLQTDAQITARTQVGNFAFLTFNHSNWMTAQTVVVTAVDDPLDGIEISRITHVVTSSGSVYAGFPTTAASRLSITVFDNETPGAIVQQTGGSTIVVEGGATDSYRVRLTDAPGSSVTLTLRTDMQTLLSGSGLVALDLTGDQGYFEYAYTFTTANWNQWANVTVSANPDFAGTDDKLKAFAAQDQNLDRIRGPLIIEGGVGAGAARALEPPVMLPGETNEISDSEFGDANTAATLESNDIDVLNVFHTDNSDADSGNLNFRTVDSGGNPIANQGLALTGFEMGGDLSVDQGASGQPSLVYYGGGITYNAFEIVEVLLGRGDENLAIDDTGDRDEEDAAVEDDHATVTAVHGGGGSDTITINDRGQGPLVVYGDTSEDGTRYSNNMPAGSIHGTSFVNAGNDTINASAMLEQGDPFVGVVIYGGGGDDAITGSQDDDHLAGGTGADTIHGQAGNDHIYGDSHFNVNLQLFAQDQLSPLIELDDVAAMFTVVTTGSGGGDIIHGDAGKDVIFGDHGIIGQVDGTRRIESTGNIIRLETTTLASGGGDVIHGNDGNDFIFGGVGNDAVYGDLGSDLIFGDHGSVAGNVDADRIGAVDGAGVDNPDATFTYTSDISGAADASAGNDTLYGGSLATLDTDSGKNILLGQQGSDTIYGGGGDDDIYGGHNVANGTDAGDFIDGAAGNDVILGDNGLIEHTAAATDPRFAVLQGQLLYDSNGLALISSSVDGLNPSAVEARRIQLFDHDDSATDNTSNFGDDTIAGGADDDVIFGELGADTVHGDGSLVGTTLVTLTTTIASSDVGGDDYVEGNGGNDWIYGGLGQDDLVGGSSSLYSLTGTGMRPDGADTIFGGNGDMIARNTEGDGQHSRDADMILGDNGNIFRIVGIDGSVNGAPTFHYDNYDALNKIVVRAAHLLDYTPGGPDLIPASLTMDRGSGDELHGESGDDFIYGMTGNDVLFGESQDDDLIGGWGHDWISGGTGQDGVLGDDGRIFTSRNGTAEPLNGVAAVLQTHITTPGNGLTADINVTGQLNKTVDLTPYNVDPAVLPSELFDPAYADDVIYGGLGDDFLHGGSGDDAISGAEAMETFYASHANNGNALQFNPVTGEFAAYVETAALERIDNFFLNFNAGEGVALGGGIFSDGDDRIFGDLGNDWLVGGTGRDHMYGGWGNDLLNADDDLGTNGGLNNAPDTQSSYEDIAFGGAGRDRLIANTAGDRLVDWSGEFNSYLVPFNPFGVGTVSRAISPAIPEFLYALSKADGADQTLGGDATRNSEPFGEIGLVKQGDAGFGSQTGAPDDPQPGNGGGKK